MAPKRNDSEKGKGKLLQKEFDVARFINFDAKKRFEKSSQRNKKFNVEIGIDFWDYGCPKVSNKIITL